MVVVGIDPKPLGFSWAALKPHGSRYVLVEKGRFTAENPQQLLVAGKNLLDKFLGSQVGVELLGDYVPSQARVAPLYRTAYTIGVLLAVGCKGVPSSGPLSWRKLLLGKSSFAKAKQADGLTKAILQRLLMELPRSNTDERDAMMVAITLHRLNDLLLKS